MNRAIKFRALKYKPDVYVGSWGSRQNIGKWVYGGGVIPVYINTYLCEKIEMVVDVNYDELNHYRSDYSKCEILPNSICQFTGVQDKTQTDVYQNDIFKFETSIGVVKFGEYKNPCDNATGGHIGFYVDWQGDDLLRKDLAYWAKKLSVCGNVFDNAELLEGGNV